MDETHASLAMRVRRLKDPTAWAETPRSHVRHCISNVQVDASPEGLQVRSNFAVYRSRGSSTPDLYCGSRRDVLVPAPPGTWRIRRGAILLEQNVLTANSISIFF